MQIEEEREMQKYCADSLCRACELCTWTEETANVAAVKWARSGLKNIPDDERAQRMEAYKKQEYDYLAWQRKQDNQKLPWVPPNCGPFIEGKPRPRKFDPRKYSSPAEKRRRLGAGSLLYDQKLTRKDFKRATRQKSTGRVQKHRQGRSEEKCETDRNNAKSNRHRYACKVCGGLNHSAKDKERCPDHRALLRAQASRLQDMWKGRADLAPLDGMEWNGMEWQLAE